MRRVLSNRWTKFAVFVLSLIPLARLVWKAFHRGLGANPIEFITHETGDWILIFLVLTLSITPARKLLGLPDLIRFRRMLGLFAFFYASLHFSVWIGLDKVFNWDDMIADVVKRRFITVGFTGLVLMIPLAITSTAGWIRRLGGKQWQRLHRLIYATAIAGVVHFYWLVKSDIHKPVRYGLIFLLLLGYRLAVSLKEKRQRSARPVGSFVSSPS